MSSYSSIGETVNKYIGKLYEIGALRFIGKLEKAYKGAKNPTDYDCVKSSLNKL